MTQSDIIRMAREAGASQLQDEYHALFGDDAIERFFRAAYAAGAAAERKACAKVCEATYEGAFEGVRPCFDTPDECAAAIRARGEK